MWYNYITWETATCYISAINLKFADMVNLICVANATFWIIECAVQCAVYVVQCTVQYS